MGHEYESRVAVSPEIVKKLINIGAEVNIEKNAGIKSCFLDQEYEKIGAIIKNNFKETIKDCDLILKIQPPSKDQISMIDKGVTLIGNFGILSNPNKIKEYEKEDI